MTVALYCRVSTDEQVHGFSIDNQKERLEAYAISQGWNDFRFYIDDGYSGTSMDRPALKRMIHHAESGRINTVIVYKLDRLGRKQKDVLFLLEDVFEKNKVTFKSATEPFDTATPLGKAMLGILAVFAQLERDTIVERVTAGRRQRIRRGLWHGGPVPFGYRWDSEKQRLYVVPEEAVLIKEAFSMYLKGQSLLYIAEWLSSRTTARTFDHSIVRAMLQRPIYSGRMNNAGLLVEGKHEAIIDIETFERVQKEMQRRIEGQTPVGEYLLSGLLRCGICGGSVIHVAPSGRRKQSYYACKNQHVRKRERSNNCSLGYTQVKKLDAAVSDRLKQLSLHPKQVEKEIKRRTVSEKEDNQLIEQLHDELKNIDLKLERWYDAFEQGILDPRKLKERIEGLEAEKKAILTRLDEVELPPEEDRTEDLKEVLGTIGEAWDKLTLDEKKIILRAALDHIILYPKGEFKLVWNV